MKRKRGFAIIEQEDAPMPANLPPQYFETEKKLKTAKSPEERISILEELLSIVPKHKGTEKLQALLKTKIAKLKSTVLKKPTIAKHGLTFHIDKAGAGQIAIIGLPNAGKSSLVKSLTNANPDIGDYPFTTQTPSPAMMQYENIQIQLIDTPPITPEYMEYWHAELIKAADGVVIVLDISSPNPVSDLENLTAKLKEKRIELVPDEQASSSEMSPFHKKSFLAVNKIDLSPEEDNLASLKNALTPDLNLIPVSATRGDNLETLRKRIFSLLNVIRVYSKIPGKKADLTDPFTLNKGASVMSLAKAVHKDFAQNLKFARIWSQSKYQGQKVNRDHILEDEDIIELHI